MQAAFRRAVLFCPAVVAAAHVTSSQTVDEVDLLNRLIDLKDAVKIDQKKQISQGIADKVVQRQTELNREVVNASYVPSLKWHDI